MKPEYFAVCLLAGFAAAAGAVDLNKEALKSMQQEGHKIVEESQAGRAYKAGGGLCLDAGSSGLVVKKCRADASTQLWQLDGKGRLVASSGKCVDGARLQKCGSGKSQTWSHDGKQRLANAAGQCLEVKDNASKAGTKVVTAACGSGSGQTWK